MSFEELFYDFLIEAETGVELDRLISEIIDELYIVKYQVVEANNLWEDINKGAAKYD